MATLECVRHFFEVSKVPGSLGTLKRREIGITTHLVRTSILCRVLLYKTSTNSFMALCAITRLPGEWIQLFLNLPPVVHCQ